MLIRPALRRSHPPEPVILVVSKVALPLLALVMSERCSTTVIGCPERFRRSTAP